MKLFWPVYPSYIRELFERAFSSEVMLKKAPRVLEREWLNAFIRFKASIVICPHCKCETFITERGENTCIECKKEIVAPNAVQFGMVTIPLYPKSKIMLWQVDASQNDVEMVLGEVVANPNDPNMFGIKNVSTISWKINLPNGTQKPLVPGAVVPIRPGFIIECTNNPKDAGKII